ncbi:hypothetical protein [Vogesella urethralis]|uniref:hypothetical protein n=1 Tax=Vogesella urethralis TaxID=2592656 RepID=UPI0011864AD6|nr:hypothetical protein [Vogesella urethralis]
MEKSIKAVLAKNLELLMKRHDRYSTNNKLAETTGLGLGTINRIRQQASAAGIDTVEIIAAKFGMKACDLLDENLEQRLPTSTAGKYNLQPVAGHLTFQEQTANTYLLQDPVSRLSTSAREAFLRGSLTEQTIDAFAQAFELLPRPSNDLKAETGEMKSTLDQLRKQQPPQ